jgi:hypothetical protein
MTQPNVDPVQTGCLIRTGELPPDFGWRVLSRKDNVAWICLVVDDRTEGISHQVVPIRIRWSGNANVWFDDEDSENPESYDFIRSDDEATEKILGTWTQKVTGVLAQAVGILQTTLSAKRGFEIVSIPGKDETAVLARVYHRGIVRALRALDASTDTEGLGWEDMEIALASISARVKSAFSNPLAVARALFTRLQTLEDFVRAYDEFTGRTWEQDYEQARPVADPKQNKLNEARDRVGSL